MPHSSGGGSHGGGSHGGSRGGSHHSGGHSGSSAPRFVTKSTDFSGSHKYVYYRDSKPQYVYSTYKKKKLTWRLLLTMILIAAIPLLIISVTCFNPPRKLNHSKDDIIISDSLHCLTNQTLLHTVLNAFQEKTGIAPAVVTVTNETWQKDYPTLEKYAYHWYVTNFKDESHWLIVYSQPENPDPNNVEWYWEGMQGNDTDEILTFVITNRFRYTLQSELNSGKRTVTQAITNAFLKIYPKLMGARFSMPESEDTVWYIRLSLLFSGVLLFSMIADLLASRPKRLPEDIEEVDRAETERTCTFCGGVYLSNRQACPYCSAPTLQAQEKNLSIRK